MAIMGSKKAAVKSTKTAAVKSVAKAAAPIKLKKQMDVFKRIRLTKSLRINQVETDPGLEVWVLNTAASTHGKTAQVFVSVKTANGNSRTVIIPDTWVPVNLTAQVPKQYLMASTEFRAALNGNQHHGALLRVISPEDAADIMESAEAQGEMARMRQARRDQQAIQSEGPRGGREDDNNVVGGTRKAKATASGMVINMVEQHKQGRLEDDVFLNTLKANAKALKAVDLEYLTANSTSGKVKKWAAKKMDS